MNFNMILIGIGMIMISGCCSFCPDKIKEVYVKTGCTPPPVVVSPALKTNSLTSTSSYKETVEAYVFDNLALIEYGTQLQMALEPYKQCQVPTK